MPDFQSQHVPMRSNTRASIVSGLRVCGGRVVIVKTRLRDLGKLVGGILVRSVSCVGVDT